MDNPVDHPIDLGLVNYTRHPSNPNYVVYRFADINRANGFEAALIEKGIDFEKDTLEKKQVTYYLFGIHKNDYKVTERLNFDVEAKYRKPFLPYAGFRYFMILFSAVVLFLAFMGYCKSQEKLQSFDEKPSTINSGDSMKNK